jgi:hypothetical protein
MATVARRRGTCERIAGKAPEGVGKSAASSFLGPCGRKARNMQKNIQAKSTPRSVQAKTICVDARVADVFMGTSFFTIYYSFASTKIAGTAVCPRTFRFSIIILDEEKLLY